MFCQHMEGIILPLLRDELYYEGALDMITNIVFNNADLSVKFGDLLIAELSARARTKSHGRQHGLHDVLESLLHADGGLIQVRLETRAEIVQLHP